MAVAATLRLARTGPGVVAPPEGFCPQVPEPVQALLDATEGIWSDGSSSSSNEPSEDPPQASRSSTAPLLMPGAPPGLEGERVVRRVSRQKLQVPGQAAARRSNFLTTPAPSARAVTISDGAPVDDRAAEAPRLLPRSFTTEPARSHETTHWSTEQLRQQMAQLQQLQQLQLQQISQYDLQQQRALLQQFQMTQMQQMRAHSLREPTPQRPSQDDPKALRRTVSAAPPNSAAEPGVDAPGSAPEEAASPGGRRRRRKSMRQVASEVTAPADSEAEMLLEAAVEDVEIIVGPTDHAVLPLSFEKLWINDDSVAVRSRSKHLSVSDVLLLKSEQEPSNTVRSFGSLLHSCRTEATCRPCMFERIPGRCKKAWLCDFCHLHSGRKKKKGNGAEGSN